MNNKNRLMTVDELAEYLQLKPATIRDWARRGWIPCVKLSAKAIRFEPEEVMSHLIEKGLIGDNLSENEPTSSR